MLSSLETKYVHGNSLWESLWPPSVLLKLDSLAVYVLRRSCPRPKTAPTSKSPGGISFGRNKRASTMGRLRNRLVKMQEPFFNFHDIRTSHHRPSPALRRRNTKKKKKKIKPVRSLAGSQQNEKGKRCSASARD
jgi:hypothetical protein